MSLIIDNIEIYMGPQQLGAPDDLRQVIVNFIDGAQTSLYIAVQELDCRPIAEAIIRAKKRDVLVKVVLEADYLVEKTPQADPFLAEGENDAFPDPWREGSDHAPVLAVLKV